MKILLTGSSGYIGSGLTKHLSSQNFDITNCDIGWFGPHVLGNYADQDISNYDVIIHFAGHSSVLLCENDENGAWLNNVVNFKKLLDRLTTNQIFIYASSGSVYGNLGIPAQETHANLESLVTYDMTKIIKDVLAINAIKKLKNIVGLRFGTVNGISPNTRVDLMLNAMIWSAKFSNQIQVKNLEIARPILFINDLYTAIQLILNNPVSGIYNLASQNVTVAEVAGKVEDLTKAKINYLQDDAKPYDFHLNCEKFIHTFGNYKTTNLDEVLNSLWEGIESVGIGRRDLLSTEQMLNL